MNDSIEYEALNFDGLERRGNYRFIAYREDMLYALDKKDAAALLYQIVYRWQAEYKKEEVLKKIETRKKSGQKPYTPEEVETMMFVYMSYNDFVRETGGAVGYNTVIRTIDYLVNDMKALKQKENHDPKYPDYEYSVNKEVVRELLKALPAQPPFAPKVPKKKSSTQMGTPENSDDQSTQMGTDSTQTGIPSTQMGTGVYPNGGTSQELTSNTQELTEEESIPEQSQNANSSPDGAILSQENTLLQEQLAKRDEQITLLLAQVTQLSTKISELSTPSVDNPTNTQADKQATSYSQTATQSSLLPDEPPTTEEKPKVPVMPPPTVRWCPEIAVQIVEAKLGKYYRQAARDKELGFAKRMFREDPELTRKQFEDAYDKRNDKWWRDHKGLLHLHHMVEKDRIHEMLDKIEVDSIGDYQGNNNNRILSFPTTTQPQPQKQLVAAGTGFFTSGPLAGQPDYHADPWA